MIESNKVTLLEAFASPVAFLECGLSSRPSHKQIAQHGARRGTRLDCRPFVLTEAEQRQLERWARGRTTPQRLALRSRIVLLLAEGLSMRRAAVEAHTTVRTVALWSNRFLEGRIPALVRDAPGRGRKPAIDRGVLEAIAAERGSSAATVRAVARKYGVSRSTVHRIWSQTRTRGRHNSGTSR